MRGLKRCFEHASKFNKLVQIVSKIFPLTSPSLIKCSRRSKYRRSSSQVSGSCSTDEMAKTALAQWTARLQSALPEGEAELSLSGGIFELRIRWADYRNDQIQQALNTTAQVIMASHHLTQMDFL